MRGDAREVDARADVYALGVMAYELLGRRLPLDLGTGSVAQAVRIVEEVNPARLGSVAADCRGDLEWIVGRAMEKDPARRYPSAAAFAKDLRRHLAHEPVEARPPSLTYQLGRLARRHRGAFAGVAAALLAIVIGTAVAVGQAVENKRLAELEREARREAEARSELLERVTSLQSSMLRSIRPPDAARVVRRELTADLSAALERADLDEAERTKALEAWLADLARADLEGALAQGLDEAFFQSAAAALTQELEGEPVEQARLLRGLADAEVAIDLHDTAVAHYERARELLRAEDGEDTPRALLLVLDVALARARQGRYGEAFALLDRHREELEERLSPYAEYGRYLRLRAVAARLRGDLPGAIESYRAALQTADAPRVEEPPALRTQRFEDLDEFNARSDLGLVLAQSGEFEEGIAILTAVVEDLDALHPNEELSAELLEFRLRISVDLGVAIWRSGSPEAGEPLLLDMVETTKSLLGTDDPLTANARAQLGRLYTDAGRYAEGEPLLRDAYRILKRTRGELSPSVFEPLLMLTRCAIVRGELDQALDWARRLYDVTSFTYAENPTVRSQGIVNLREVLQRLHQRDPDAGWETRARELHDELAALGGV